MPSDSFGPAIGLTLPSPAADPRDRRRDERARAAYRRALESQGARVVELRPGGTAHSVHSLDALLLSGGGDLHPSHYGEPPHPKLARVDPARDELELRLAEEALAAGLAVLGICRGAQVLGVVLGGGLIQDIPTHVEGAEQHAPGANDGVVRHWVSVAPGSRLSELLGARRVRVNSSHHQANSRLGDAVRSVAWSGDGVIEAVERDGPQFVVGVQWHPERMWRRAPRQRRLLAAFVAAAREGAAHRPRS